MNLTPIQQSILDEMSKEHNGWANGHDAYMICNVDVGELLDFLNGARNISSFSYAKVNEQGNAISFDGNGDRWKGPTNSWDFDLLESISSKFPEARCYWADQWDNIAAVDFYVGYDREGKLPIVIDKNEPSEEDGEEYRIFEARIVDEESGLELSIGGGMVSKEYADTLVDIIEYENENEKDL